MSNITNNINTNVTINVDGVETKLPGTTGGRLQLHLDYHEIVPSENVKILVLYLLDTITPLDQVDLVKMLLTRWLADKFKQELEPGDLFWRFHNGSLAVMLTVEKPSEKN